MIIQGTIGGVAFWALGVEAALLWGVTMTFLSMLACNCSRACMGSGSSLVGPHGRLAESSDPGPRRHIVIGLIDNLLRPPWSARETRLPDYVVLISTVGGISLFGINVFVIGPLIAALFIAAWSIFAEQQNAGRLKSNVLNEGSPASQHF